MLFPSIIPHLISNILCNIEIRRSWRSLKKCHTILRKVVLHLSRLVGKYIIPYPDKVTTWTELQKSLNITWFSYITLRGVDTPLFLFP